MDKSKPISETDLEFVRVRCQVIALESVVAMLLTGLYRVASKDGKAVLLAKLDELPQKLGQTHLPGSTPELSDLMASELQDAGESLASFLTAHLADK